MTSKAQPKTSDDERRCESRRGAGRDRAGVWRYPPAEILAAVDFSDGSAGAVRVAGLLAGRHDACLTLLHAEALEAPLYFTADQVERLERQRAASREAAAKFLESFSRPLTSHPVEVLLGDEPPAAAILEAARLKDLITMGTHGRRGPSRWWLGSVAERVVREARVPVLVMRGDPGPEAVSSVFGRIVTLVAPGLFAGAVETYAAGLARTFGGSVVGQRETIGRERPLPEHPSLLVVGLAPRGARWVSESTEHVLRSCAAPVLFIPAVAAS